MKFLSWVIPKWSFLSENEMWDPFDYCLIINNMLSIWFQPSPLSAFRLYYSCSRHRRDGHGTSLSLSLSPAMNEQFCMNIHTYMLNEFSFHSERKIVFSLQENLKYNYLPNSKMMTLLCELKTTSILVKLHLYI